METRNILIVDNNLIDLFVNRKILENFEINKIHCVKGANEALEHLNDTTTKYHYILTDINLPLLDGFDFFDKFLEMTLNNKHGEFVFLSASINPLDKEKAKQRNIKFIEKPLTIEKLFNQDNT